MFLIPVVLAIGLMQEVHSFLRLSTHAVRREEPSTLGDIGKEMNSAGKALEKTQQKAADKLQKGPGEKNADKKPMDQIEVMRAMMCWGRKKLLEHEDCMKWMVKRCSKETSGEGYCKKLRRYVKSKCKRGTKKGCDYAKDLGIDMATDKEVLDPDDMDGDGIKDKDDAFPDNPLESKDSDGDGVGDNADKFPNDPTCNKEGDICGGPAPAPAMSPAPAPAAPVGLKMDENVPLPSQGYNEFSNEYVAHDDGKTMTRDWRSEWPMSGGDEDSSIEKICAKNPKHAWCKLKNSAAARKAYRRSHP